MNHELVNYLRERMNEDQNLTDEAAKTANRKATMDYVKAKGTAAGVTEAQWERSSVNLDDTLKAMRGFAAIHHVVDFEAANQLALALLDDAVETAKVQRGIDRALDMVNRDGGGLFLEARNAWLLDADAVATMRDDIVTVRDNGAEVVLKRAVDGLVGSLGASHGLTGRYSGATEPRTAIAMRALESKFAQPLIDAVVFASSGNLKTARAAKAFADALKQVSTDGATMNAIGNTKNYYDNTTSAIGAIAFGQLTGMLDHIIEHGSAEGFDFKGGEAALAAAETARDGDHRHVTLEV